eukprot:m.1280773 g.1280773  ORF g.1280773 m.1280773 type:complete len:215 (-) comp24769_c0_seq23:414-1058(-)
MEVAPGIRAKDIADGTVSANTAVAVLAAERQSIASDMRKAAAAAAGLTAAMIAETQAMLGMFGLPYVVAPMEAEAQCAAMELDGLTKGSISDDSDIFLFGGRNVYRRVCSKNKSPEKYSATQLQRCLGLDREKLIRLAYLLGCDYTAGIAGVGVVTAMEILAEFPGEKPIRMYREITIVFLCVGSCLHMLAFCNEMSMHHVHVKPETCDHHSSV